MRQCKGCSEDKPLFEFNIALTTKNKRYRKWKCKRCELDDEIVRYSNKSNSVKQERSMADLRARLKHRNGITIECYEEMLMEQNGKCFVCGEPPGKRKLAVDHDHRCCPDTRKACGDCKRALLCFRCNSTLGKFNDDPSLLRTLADYLEWFEGSVHIAV